jgi:hypothetical protein
VSTSRVPHISHHHLVNRYVWAGQLRRTNVKQRNKSVTIFHKNGGVED